MNSQTLLMVFQCVMQFQGHLKDSNEFKLVSEQRIRGSCPSYSVRKNVTQDIRSQAEYLHLEAACQRYALNYQLALIAAQQPAVHYLAF